MIEELEEYYRPASLEEAIKILKKGKGSIVPISGGTSIVLYDSRRIKGVVDLSVLPLDYIKSDKKGIRIGATTLVKTIAANKAIQKLDGGMLAEACGAVASTPVRNLVTLGGNIIQVLPWSDTGPALLCLDALVHIKKPKERVVGIEDFFAKHPLKTLSPMDIVTEIEIPSLSARSGGHFLKFTKTSYDYTMLDVAVRLTLKGKQIAEARIAVGGIGTLPFRIKEAEDVLCGEETSQKVFEEAGLTAARIARPLPDERISQVFRKEILGVFVRRALEESLRRIQK